MLVTLRCDTVKRLLFISTLYCTFVVEKYGEIGGPLRKQYLNWDLKNDSDHSKDGRIKWCDCSGLWSTMNKVFKTIWSFVFSTKWNGIRCLEPRRKEERIWVEFEETDHIRSLTFKSNRGHCWILEGMHMRVYVYVYVCMYTCILYNALSSSLGI